MIEASAAAAISKCRKRFVIGGLCSCCATSYSFFTKLAQRPYPLFSIGIVDNQLHGYYSNSIGIMGYTKARVVSTLFFAATMSLLAQDDVTTQNAATAYGGGYITGPASNPLSFLNGPAYRTFGTTAPYDFPDF